MDCTNYVCTTNYNKENLNFDYSTTNTRFYRLSKNTHENNLISDILSRMYDKHCFVILQSQERLLRFTVFRYTR